MAQTTRWCPPAAALPGRIGLTLLTERGTPLLNPADERERVGAGGEAVVYRARAATGPVRDVVVKFPDPVDPGWSGERFRQTALLARQFDSPHLVRVLDVLELGPHAAAGWPKCAVVAEYLEDTLENVLGGLSQGRLPETTVRRWVQGLARGLAEAHARGFVLRDVKPANIFVRLAPGGNFTGRAAECAGSVLVHGDYGTMAEINTRPDPLHADDPNSEMNFKPIEQFTHGPLSRPKRIRVTPAFDVYALGLCLKQLLTVTEPGPHQNELARLVAECRGPAFNRPTAEQVAERVMGSGAVQVVDQGARPRVLRGRALAWVVSGGVAFSAVAGVGVTALFAQGTPSLPTTDDTQQVANAFPTLPPRNDTMNLPESEAVPGRWSPAPEVQFPDRGGPDRAYFEAAHRLGDGFGLFSAAERKLVAPYADAGRAGRGAFDTHVFVPHLPGRSFDGTPPLAPGATDRLVVRWPDDWRLGCSAARVGASGRAATVEAFDRPWIELPVVPGDRDYRLFVCLVALDANTRNALRRYAGPTGPPLPFRVGVEPPTP